MNILITGGLGHIGSMLSIYLARTGHDVYIMDNMDRDYYFPLFKIVREARGLIRQDILNRSELEKLCDYCDVVVHLAAITDAASSHLWPDKVKEVNVEGTRRVIEACLKYDKYLVFPSTTSVYGVSEGLVDESGETYPQSVYADSKLESEADILLSRPLQATILRLGTIYGASPGMRFHTAVNKFCLQAHNKKPLTIWKTAYKQLRPYLYLGDCVRAISMVIDFHTHKVEIYNVVTGNHTVEDVLNTLLVEHKIEWTDSPIMNQLSYEVSAEKFQKAFNFKFVGTLSEGIKETFEMLRGL